MPLIDRRTFLAAGSALLGAGLGLGPVRPAAHRRVVVFFLRGGADGLSIVIPHGDPLYHQARPTLALAPDELIDLDGYFGLHPALGALQPWWDNDRLAIAPAAGISGALRSHVDAESRLRRCLATAGSDVVVIESGGWDTHLNQGVRDGQFAARLRALSRDIVALASRLGERMRDTTIVTVSEFGRTVRENANGGTDHGRASAMLVLGGTGTGGIIGGWPGLGGGPDVAVTSDYSHTIA